MAHQPHSASASSTSIDDRKYGSVDNKDTLATDGEAPGFTSSTLAGEHVFDDPKLGKFFVPIPEYEGLHRFDPKATWTEAEERCLVRKIDKRIMIWCCVMFFALQLDRGNISAALSDNFLKDLKFNTNDYNNGQMIFLLSFMCAELPSQLVSKRLGPDVWLPIQLVLWSIVAMSQCKINSRGSFFATRCLLGLLEGGFIPDMVLFLSYFYKGAELPVRLSFFWVSLTLTNISGALLGYGILRMRDDPSKGDMHNRQALRFADFWASITDYDNWGLYLIGLCAYIPPAPTLAYLTLTLRNLGFSTFNTNLLTIPSSVLFIINNLLLAQLSRITGERSIVSSLGNVWILPLFIALAVLPDHTNPWIRFVVLTLLIGYPYPHPILVGWNSSNSNTVRTRTVSAALYNICVQAGNIIATRIYNDADKPYYHKGNKVLIGICVWNIVLFFLVKLYYIRRNKWKAERWNAMTKDEKANYLATTTDKGNKRLGSYSFPFVLGSKSLSNILITDFVFVH
ncbi:major facilitator superfamily transporter [Ceratobasidium sp. AG-Ba]|nr:major facilitator superfamily transporter [Ceratobasidium sp. AG-Ba]